MPRPALAWLAPILALALACSPGARRGNTVILASGADLQSMNSLVTTHPLAKQVQRYALLTTLVQLDSTLEPVPYLARRWTWSADRRELTMFLHAGVKWHDGQPTTAADAAWTLGAALDPATGYPRLTDLYGLTDALAVDDTTLVLRFSEPRTGIPDVLSDLAILPRHLLGDVDHAELRRAPWNDQPVGNGPFRFVTHEANRRWVFEANPAFPPSLGGRPALDRLVVAVVDEPLTKLAALTSGELDFAGIQPAHATFVERDPELRVLEYPLLFSYALVFNTRRPPFDELAVRRAIGLAIDREAIVQGYLFGFGRPASGPLPPELDSAGGPPALYAPGRGRGLLGDRTLRFELLTVGSGEAPLEQMLQSQLAAIGVEVVIRPVELSTFLDRIYGPGRDFDAAVMGISGDLELGYLRSLLDVTGMAAPGGARGRELLPIYADSEPVVFLYHARGVQGMNRRVRGVRMDLRGELVSLSRWTTAPVTTASAPVRLDFAGGWTDVAPFATEVGGLVVNAAIELRASVTVEPAEQYELSSAELGLTVHPRGPADLEKNGELDLLKAAVRMSGIGPCRIRTRSDAPPGSGLGSSGAMDVALAAAIAAHQGERVGPAELAERAWRLEAVEAALPGGRQDQYAAALGGFHQLRFGAGGVTADRLEPDPAFAEALAAGLAICHTGRSRVSSETIARVMRRFVEGDAIVTRALHGLVGVADRMASAFRAGDLGRVGALLSENWALQRALDPAMQTDAMARLERIMHDAGALGGKAAGSGAGGAMFFLLGKTPAHAVAAARSAGAPVLPAVWSREGVRVW